MTTDIEKIENKSIDTLKIGVYSIYDCVLQKFEPPFCVNISRLDDYLTLLVNEPSSKYYNHESDYIVNKVGDFNDDNGEIELHFIERLNILDSYVDLSKRKLQTIIQTLNYLPQGYFKMPQEQKNSIQENIDNKIRDYVENYVIPDLDAQEQQSLIIKQLKDELAHLKETSISHF